MCMFIWNMLNGGNESVWENFIGLFVKKIIAWCIVNKFLEVQTEKMPAWVFGNLLLIDR